MRIIVCGGRDYNDKDAVWGALEALRKVYKSFTVIQGGARGADSLAASWANSQGVPSETYPADWNKHGKAAGPIRNREMLAAGADLVLAFKGGRGTADMVRAARAANVKVWEPANDKNRE